jgi:pilus assembly protein Flp/PilA
VDEKYTICGQIAAAMRPNRDGRGDREIAMRDQWLRFLADESAATAIEYAVICGCMFLAIVGAITTFAAKATNIFNTIASNVG